MSADCVCPRCRIECALRRALCEGVDAVGVRVVVDAFAEIAVERMRQGRLLAACNLLAASAGLAYYAHRYLPPEPPPESARPAACEVN